MQALCCGVTCGLPLIDEEKTGTFSGQECTSDRGTILQIGRDIEYYGANSKK
jgi:hypothetical protein